MQEHRYQPPRNISNTFSLRESTSMVAANVAAGKFRTSIAKGGVKEEGNLTLEKYLPVHSRLSNMSSQGVDSTSLEDISSLKILFEKGASKQTTTTEAVLFPAICAPRLTRPVSENPSLTAATLATQLLSSDSPQSTMGGNPILKRSSQSAQGIPTSLSFNNGQNSHNTAHELSPSLLKSEGSAFSNAPTLSDHKNELLAATLVVKPKIPKDSPLKSQPPKPPPPRRGQNNLKASNGKTFESEYISDTLSDRSVKMGCSKYDTTRSSMSLKLPLSDPTALPISPIPKRRLSLGNIPHQTTCNKPLTIVSAVALSTASYNTSPVNQRCDQPLPLSQRLTGDSVMAASLAQSRMNSPAPRKPPAPPAPRRGRRKSLPPPLKTGLRETTREPRSSPGEANSQRKMPHSVKHHSHKHSEGDRRRWRCFITDAERKRYERLWAANKGLLLVTCDLKSGGPIPYSLDLQRTKFSGPQNLQHVVSSTPNNTESLPYCVNSLVARDIWIRSRLPSEHLADIWDLVDRDMKGRLSRDEFVVGTWLIDQSLKGRKLPTSVQDEVWQSVRRLDVNIAPSVRKSATYSERR